MKITSVLQEYQTGIPVPSTSIPEQIYDDLAWGGLIDVPVFDATYPVGNPNRQRILNRYEAEQRNLPIGIIPNVQIPASVPCN